jgi:hypothetical protein
MTEERIVKVVRDNTQKGRRNSERQKKRWSDSFKKTNQDNVLSRY